MFHIFITVLPYFSVQTMTYKSKAYAKINLSLDILGKRDDGYHNLLSVMHTVPLFDELEFVPNDEGVLRIKTNKSGLCPLEKNIVYKAWKAFYDKAALTVQGFDITLVKNIPDSAGLAGGSSDGAETLKFLNEYHNNPLSKEELIKTGASVGADIPFLIKGGCCLCEGIGEILTPLPELKDVNIIIAKPSQSGLSTPEIFALCDEKEQKYHPDTKRLINGLETGNLKEITSSMYNVMEEASLLKCPEIAEIKKVFSDNGAEIAMMSGSGNSVFGIFKKNVSLEKAVSRLNNLNFGLFINKLSL